MKLESFVLATHLNYVQQYIEFTKLVWHG